MISSRITTIFAIALAPLLTWGDATSEVSHWCQQWEDLPIRQRGRVKPLYVHVRESIKYLTGKTRVENRGALDLYCSLSLPPALTPSEAPPLRASIQHVELRQYLGMGEEQKALPYPQFLEHRESLQLALSREEKNHGPYKKALERALGQMALYQDIRQGGNWMVYGGGEQWIPLAGAFVPTPNSDGHDTLGQLATVLERSKENYLRDHGDKHLIELLYAKSSIYQLIMGGILLSIFALVLIKNPLPGLLGAGLCLLLQLAAIVLRIIISGRAPITNMYETVLFSGFACLAISLLVGHLRKEKIYVLGGLGYNFLCTLMLNFAHGMVSGDISPLVPVLRDNFWLSTHVTTVILSYAAFALSWMLANMALVKRSFRGIGAREYRHYCDLIYTCLKVGTVLLSLGVILGGVWADYSWGRFWGWDPKETWSAIALCIYLAILHGRYTNWIGDKQFVPAVAGAFMSIMMAWFGVNYILASGLHSYGFSEGGAIFLGSFFAVQTALILATTLMAKNKNPQ